MMCRSRYRRVSHHIEINRPVSNRTSHLTHTGYFVYLNRKEESNPPSQDFTRSIPRTRFVVFTTSCETPVILQPYGQPRKQNRTDPRPTRHTSGSMDTSRSVHSADRAGVDTDNDMAIHKVSSAGRADSVNNTDSFLDSGKADQTSTINRSYLVQWPSVIMRPNTHTSLAPHDTSGGVDTMTTLKMAWQTWPKQSSLEQNLHILLASLPNTALVTTDNRSFSTFSALVVYSQQVNNTSSPTIYDFLVASSVATRDENDDGTGFDIRGIYWDAPIVTLCRAVKFSPPSNIIDKYLIGVHTARYVLETYTIGSRDPAKLMSEIMGPGQGRSWSIFDAIKSNTDTPHKSLEVVVATQTQTISRLQEQLTQVIQRLERLEATMATEQRYNRR